MFDIQLNFIIVNLNGIFKYRKTQVNKNTSDISYLNEFGFGIYFFYFNKAQYTP